MKRAAVVVPLLILIGLAGCAGQATAADPTVTCIDVAVEYGLSDDRTDGAEFCVWLEDHETLLGDKSFAETFSDLDLAREWAKAEVAKQ